MNTAWKKIKLGDLLTIKHGWAFKGEYFCSEGELILLTPGNFHEEGGFKIQIGKEKFYSGAFPKEYLLKKDDLIIAMTEQGAGLLGSPAIVPQNDRFLHNQRLGLLQIDHQKAITKYIYYLFFTKEVRNSIFSTATGTKVRHTAPKRIYNIEINLPPLETQTRIANILSAYDDLIENNLRRIKLLEEMAELTYREWFANFKIGGKPLEIDKNTGLPLGWERRSLTLLGEFLNGYAFKPEDWEESGFPIIKIKELKGGISNDTPRNNGSKIPSKFIVKSGDILFSWSASLEVVVWQGETGLLNQHLFKVTPFSKIPKSLLFLALKDSLNIFNNLSTGATMKHIKRKELDFVEIPIPQQDILNQFDNVISPIIKQTLNLSHQNRLLKESRDILLPRLMSGKIGV
ncbi:restriction modification system DNA specificity domain-containing protein (plasmid) [Emticicia oligotrophica DSM 17448]|uniref:Restriction modification system DNA specificity domain-containing protein n=1 Tax=Emticicia oligotrophica (strain DSM 17448 / CIP 109782 / MTCC 6937 / GPTSA100-15) TaxID=929562 RepID=A0ABN4AS28_EMTOG|nr:restriction endonuclease subunit S [Emticicia oligotrophica]AFK05467.1 restriction modification system DNA specificity domain-containing protein [Emticicia oligotrophica DSM 17448]